MYFNDLNFLTPLRTNMLSKCLQFKAKLHFLSYKYNYDIATWQFLVLKNNQSIFGKDHFERIPEDSHLDMNDFESAKSWSSAFMCVSILQIS